MIIALTPQDIIDMVRDDTLRQMVRRTIAELDRDITPVTPLRRPSKTAERSLTQLTFVIEGMKEFLRQAKSSGSGSSGGRRATTRTSSRGRPRRNRARSESTETETEIETETDSGSAAISSEIEEKLQEEMLWLKLDSGCQVHETKNLQDTAEYIYLFSEVVATAPYKSDHLSFLSFRFVSFCSLVDTFLFFSSSKRCPSFWWIDGVENDQRDKNYFTSFCAEGLERKTSKDPKEIWKQQLMQITNVSEQIATAIVSHYPTFSSLFKLYRAPSMSLDQKRNLLRDIMLSNRKIGPAISAKIHRAFADPNPNTRINDTDGL